MTTPDPAPPSTQAADTGAVMDAEPAREDTAAHDTLAHDTSEHGEDEELGPIDWPTWGISAAGIAIGLLIAVCLAIAANS